jgi:hypothetical protein
VLNPAGFSPARAWPTASYIEFARLWIERHPRSQIVLLLMAEKRAKPRRFPLPWASTASISRAVRTSSKLSRSSGGRGSC